MKKNNNFTKLEDRILDDKSKFYIKLLENYKPVNYKSFKKNLGVSVFVGGKERYEQRLDMLKEVIRFAITQLYRGIDIKEVVEQVESSYPLIAYCDFLNLLSQRLELYVKHQ